MTWGSTVNGVTATQRKIAISMLRAQTCTARHLAKVFEVTPEAISQNLRALRKHGIVGYQRKKNVGWWSLSDPEGALSLAWPLMAKSEGHRRGVPRSPADLNSASKTSSVVDSRKAKIVEMLTEMPGLSRTEVCAAISGCTDNDFANLRMSGRIHTKWLNRRWCYFAGPAEAEQ